MKTILITGINGFLGSNLAKWLGGVYKIIGIVNSFDNLNRLSGYTIPVFLSDTKSLESVFRENNIDVIIHAATVYGKKNETITQIINSNIMMPIKLMELANTYKLELFINTDSFFNRTGPSYNYLNEYTLSKKHVLEWLRIMRFSGSLINMKLFHVYGPNDAPNKFIPEMIEKLRNNYDNIELTPGNQIRDFIFIDDVCSAFEFVLKKNDEKTKYLEIEIGLGIGLSIKEFLIKLKDIIGSNTRLKFGALEYRDNELMHAIADTTFIRGLGWEPKTDIDNGLHKIVNNL